MNKRAMRGRLSLTFVFLSLFASSNFSKLAIGDK